MVKIVAYRKGSNIIIEDDSFEHLLNCLDNQKFVGESPPCGDAMALSTESYNAIQEEIQAAIDDCRKQCRDILGFGPILRPEKPLTGEM